MHVVLAPVWGRANSGAKLSSCSSGHVQGTHSSPALGCCSLTSYLSQFLSQQAKHFFLIFIPFPHKCASQNNTSCSYLSWADWQFLRHRGWLCDQTLGMLCSTLFLHGGTALYCRIWPATIYWHWIYHWEQYSFSCPQFIIYFIVIEEENLENFLLRWLNEWKNYEVLFCQNNFWLIAQYIFFFLVWIFLFLPCHCFYGLHPLLSISL